MTRIKICGLTRPADVELAVELGADAVGFVLEPTSPRCVDLESLPDLLRWVPEGVDAVLVYGPPPASLPEARFSAVQSLPPRPAAGRWLGCLRLGPKFRLGSLPRELEPAEAVVLDAFDRGSYGGTGRTVDWEAAAAVVGAWPKPVVLAGGLAPENVAEAVRRVRPWGVDVSSGVEARPGVKDPARLAAFVQAVREADEQKKARER
ncbi:MAG: phosphoribosylanthranilate isomerase [Fimbriimonadales bacterium]|nr:phosphoribosylanthranilate isomerase [Fimbriimonadales bacterium]